MLKFKVDSELLSDLYDKDLIAYGTGNVGKIVIPYLAQDTRIRLKGVTNSRIRDDETGTFIDTALPLLSVSIWAKCFPHATVLVTATDELMVDEIVENCKNAGFQNIVYIPKELVTIIACSYTNSHILPQSDFLDRCLAQVRAEVNPLMQLVCMANELHETHKASFSEFKACHRGETVVIVATGPSMKYYTQIQGVPHIGVNAAFKRKDITLDYYFLIHSVPDWMESLKDHNFVKFFGYHDSNVPYDNIIFPESFIEENKGRRFYQNIPSKTIYTNIEYYPLMGFGSIVFQALHFALYTRPKRILLVGCDCTWERHFDGSPMGGGDDAISRLQASLWHNGYQQVKAHVDRYYPDTEIISVNPVGLKGMFHDVYTESYLEVHKEISCSAVEILNSDDYKKE